MNYRAILKIDLHLHLDGVIRVPTMAALGDELGIPLNVFYFEARFAPALAASDSFTMTEAVEAALEGFRRGQRDFGIACRLILCCYRSISPAQNLATVQLARRLELPITIHAGEGDRAEHIQEAVFEHGAVRIGHGIARQRDRDLLHRVRDAGTCFEICLTGNQHTGSVPTIQAHPFRRFIEEDVRVTLNTDDPAISNITLTHEFELAGSLGVTDRPVQTLLANAAAAAFVEPAVRQQLQQRLETGSSDRPPE